jgi:hypothetical protein
VYNKHFISCFEVCLNGFVEVSSMLIVNFVVSLLKVHLASGLFVLFQSKFIFVFRTASNFSVQDSCTFTACFVIF